MSRISAERTGSEPSYVEVASSELAREINRDLILELIRIRQPIPRVDLARASGLQNSTVSSIVEQLLAEGWIREGEAVKTARGRRPTQICLNDNLAMLVADVHPGRAILAAVDLNGQVLAKETVMLARGVQQSVRELGRALSEMRDRHPERVFMGAGVCLPGRIDTDTGRLMIAPNLHWQRFDIRAALTARLGMTVELENDANACLLSELWFGHLDGVRDAVLLAISEGVGASILAGGHLISGQRGVAGEFGHICYDPSGPVCGCGRKGCWEVFASSRAAVEYYVQAGGKRTGVTYQELSGLALEGDQAALKAVERQAIAVGRGLRMVTAALSPEIILFAGEIACSWAISQPILERECVAGMLSGSRPRLVCTGSGDQVHLLGAAAVVLQRHSEYYHARSNEATTRG